MQSTFRYDNIIPQFHTLNGGLWSQLEHNTRLLVNARQDGSKVLIQCGALFLDLNAGCVFLDNVSLCEIRITPCLYIKCVSFCSSNAGFLGTIGRVVRNRGTRRANRLLIPTHLYKVIMYQRTLGLPTNKRHWVIEAYLFANDASVAQAGLGLAAYQVDCNTLATLVGPGVLRTSIRARKDTTTCNGNRMGQGALWVAAWINDDRIP